VATTVAVLVALTLTAAIPLLSRRRMICPASASLGLLAGAAWLAVTLIA
jgi:hypothetical protein